MPPLDAFRESLSQTESLAPLTWFRLGGPAEFLVRPKSVQELADLVSTCREHGLMLRLLGGGSNLLIRDEGVKGVVAQLEAPVFSEVQIRGREVTAGATVPLTALISQTARAGLAGLEILTGIPGTVGGALRGNAGGRAGAIGQFVRSVTVIDAQNKIVERSGEDLQFAYRASNLDEPVILSCTFELEAEDPESVVKRMRRIWIVKKENQPYGHQSSGCIFKNPSPDVSAGLLVERAGLKGMRIGGAEVSERHANFIVAQPGTTSADVLALIDLIRQRVQQHSGHDLELQIQVW